jgi:hypothetical protein
MDAAAAFSVSSGTVGVGAGVGDGLVGDAPLPQAASVSSSPATTPRHPVDISELIVACGGRLQFTQYIE